MKDENIFRLVRLIRPVHLSNVRGVSMCITNYPQFHHLIGTAALIISGAKRTATDLSPGQHLLWGLNKWILRLSLRCENIWDFKWTHHEENNKVRPMCAARSLCQSYCQWEPRMDKALRTKHFPDHLSLQSKYKRESRNDMTQYRRVTCNGSTGNEPHKSCFSPTATCAGGYLWAKT